MRYRPIRWFSYEPKDADMATIEECRAALDKFAEKIASDQDGVASKLDFERRLACDISDLGHAFRARFTAGTLTDIADGDDPDAEIRMTVSSDDLVALVNEELDLTKAFASGRVKIKANFMDLLKLKKML